MVREIPFVSAVVSDARRRDSLTGCEPPLDLNRQASSLVVGPKESQYSLHDNGATIPWGAFFRRYGDFRSLRSAVQRFVRTFELVLTSICVGENANGCERGRPKARPENFA